jgi:predicted RNA-binding Zn-ribbon protein involved in translation (DUF1610 family)
MRNADGGVTVDMNGKKQLLTCPGCGQSKMVPAHIARKREEYGYECAPCKKDIPSPEDMATEEPDDIIL